MINNIEKEIVEIVLDKAAPINPKLLSIPNIFGNGIKIKFNIKFKIEQIIVFIRFILDLPIIDTKYIEIIKTEDMRLPIKRILNPLDANKYSFPNNRLIITPGKRIIKINIGKFIKKIHFVTCLLSSEIMNIFFLEYSFIIRGKNNFINKIGVTNKRVAIVRAELYNPTSETVLKWPNKKESIELNIPPTIFVNNNGNA
jgi:hypothetical protein